VREQVFLWLAIMDYSICEPGSSQGLPVCKLRLLERCENPPFQRQPMGSFQSCSSLSDL
jgi:hypothetical protein